MDPRCGERRHHPRCEHQLRPHGILVSTGGVEPLRVDALELLVRDYLTALCESFNEAERAAAVVRAGAAAAEADARGEAAAAAAALAPGANASAEGGSGGGAGEGLFAHEAAAAWTNGSAPLPFSGLSGNASAEAANAPAANASAPFASNGSSAPPADAPSAGAPKKRRPAPTPATKPAPAAASPPEKKKG